MDDFRPITSMASSLPPRTYDSASIEAAVDGVRGGNLEMFTAIVHQFHGPLRRYVFSRCPHGGEPDDVVQRIFLLALNELGRYQPGTDFEAWLFTLARFEVMTECNRIRRDAEKRARLAQAALAAVTEQHQLDLSATGWDRIKALEHCMEALSPGQRELIRLRYEGQHSLADISAKVDRSIGALKKTFFYLRQSLLNCVTARELTEANS